ncbi:MAG: Phosphoesterase family protein [Arthrobacter sp.]|nr:Phosphoesterase family protein [Arthrobacter sp.]
MSPKSGLASGKNNTKELLPRRVPRWCRWLSVATTLVLVAAALFIGTPAEAATLTFSASADAVVKRAHPTTNYGTATGLRADNSPVEMVFLKFTVTGTAGRTVTGARLRLFATDPSNRGGQVRRVLNNSWSEPRITFNNAPVAQAPVVASRGAVADNTFVEFDLTSVIKRDGTYSFRISNTSAEGVIYSSKETSTATQRPRLIVTTNATPPSAANPCGKTSAPPARYEHVIWIIFENKTYSQVIGNARAPYMTRTARQCASVATWRDGGLGLPSLPSYLAMTSGSTQGVRVNSHPGGLPTIRANNIFRQVRATGQSHKSYMESMPSNCHLRASGLYAERHNPEIYYQGPGDRAACATRNVPMGTVGSGHLARDLANNTLPNFSVIVPNDCNNMHDCSVGTGDTWLSRWLPVILASQSYRAGKTAIFVVFDEDTPIPNFIVAPSVVPGTVIRGSYSHYSLLRTTEEMLGIGHKLLNAGTALSLRRPLRI